MPKLDSQVLAHLERIGFVRPTGLVVSAPALVRAGAILRPPRRRRQRRLRERIQGEDDPRIGDSASSQGDVLGWSFSPKGYAGTEDGWTDIPTDCDFFLDYEIDEEEWRNRKKPWRYRWPDDVRDEVLARLLELNADRAREEIQSGAEAEKKRGRKRASRRRQSGSPTGTIFK
jgi:hypothetical protein